MTQCESGGKWSRVLAVPSSDSRGRDPETSIARRRIRMRENGRRRLREDRVHRADIATNEKKRKE